MALVYQRASLGKVLALVLYIFLYSIIFLPSAQNAIPVFLTLIVSSSALWFGAFSLIEIPKKHRWYDPTVLFNTAIFYYSIKGLTLGYEIKLSYLRFVPVEKIPRLYLYASLCLLGGLLAWNWLYRVAIHQVPNAEAVRRKKRPYAILESAFLRRSPILILSFSVVGLLSFVFIFQSIGLGIAAFLKNPILRSYLTDGTLGVRSPLANFWIIGSYMFPLASCLWLAAACVRKRRPHPLWYFHAAFSIFIYALVAGRAALLGFLVTVSIIFSLTKREISKKILILAGMAAALYAYSVNIWRAIAGSHNGPVLSAIQTEVANNFSTAGFLKFLSGTDLTDIRLFPFVLNTYGVTHPLHWGDTLLGIVTQLIPRAIWAGKPLDLGMEVGSLSEGYGGLAGTPPGFFPEMFMNFHVLGVILGGGALGFGIGVLYRKWVLTKRSTVSAVLYSLLAPGILLSPSSTFANVFLGVAIPSLAFIVAMKIVSLGSPGTYSQRPLSSRSDLSRVVRSPADGL
jgi:hypothetical protein